MKSFIIRLWVIHNLIFFISFFLISCDQNSEENISIVWEDNKAVAFQIPNINNPDDLEIRLIQDGKRVSIIGKIEDKGNQILFTPIIPFTRGLSYELILEGKEIASIQIPLPDGLYSIPKIVSIYPSQDTVPENLLKIYISFSQPMKEGVALNFISLLDSEKDTIPGVFLDLQPELWNETRTQLTIWLDPGRIKRDLIPNLEMGAPLKNEQRYELIIADGWKDQNGLGLAKYYTKNFIVTGRDSISPDPKLWQLKTPKSNSKTAFEINFSETLDYSLLNEVFQIKNEEMNIVSGKWEIGLEEKSIQFFPDENWGSGSYQLEIESRLEDLAGNNLNRLFEIDLENTKAKEIETSFRLIPFSVKE
ncbi:Ig-like domain-containing protein [Algoriphagus sp.]|uniref:Ig-like domain-containing protein n=1 Tax=Algoriphagus sp. TaxID=1872435 RepID=UPI0025F68E9C|nr:Ig-like domain-containing protein [Algoriphagus sp.]